ncbi:MAG: 30S ribosomal protein S16 [Chloroflexota bacterium]
MVRIRLSRRGKKRQPLYRVIVADQKSKRDGRFIEHIGNYNPHTDPPTFNVKEGRALYWLSVGAQPSDAVRRLLDKQGTLDRLKRLHAGEDLSALVAEFDGPADAAEKEEAAVEEVVEAVAGEVAEAADEAVEEVAEATEETAEEAVEEASDAVEDAAEATEE